MRSKWWDKIREPTISSARRLPSCILLVLGARLSASIQTRLMTIGNHPATFAKVW